MLQSVRLSRPFVSPASTRTSLTCTARRPDRPSRTNARLQPRGTAGVAPTVKAAPPPPAIKLTDKALSHLQRLRADKGRQSVILRMGVRSGGCSGMTYFMDFEDEDKVLPSDAVMEYEEGFKLVCDSKSLLYLFGMSLDYSDELIGGGFKFNNPNAESSCGCGKSFGA
ncbi:hypothetical protein ACKKBG_A00330 [Auxenochlorella protothecoides x Auxenochlorella symbiontica]|uniref:Core domain-containing protein n=2 Tax=Auxenochlorella protothecoides TaxID=3075 RepID=A0A1D2ACC9_AUXPR